MTFFQDLIQVRSYEVIQVERSFEITRGKPRDLSDEGTTGVQLVWKKFADQSVFQHGWVGRKFFASRSLELWNRM